MIPKFRYWDRHEQKMYDSSQIVIWDGNAYQHDYQKIFDRLIGGKKGLVGRSLHDDYLMQSTGLKDKNGVEIFEGAILKDDWESGKVVYDPDRTMWRVYGKDFDDALSDWWMGRVVGNIYENPELMEADNDPK